MAEKRISITRSKSGFSRKAGLRIPSKTMLIVCEVLTEEKYFKAIRKKYGLRTAQIEICSNKNNSAPINIVNKAERMNGQPGDFDYLFCVFDKDQHQTFDEARQRIKYLSTRKMKPLPINEAVSVPSFELWILLHYERTDRAFNTSQEVIGYLEKNHHVPKYIKGDETLCTQLLGQIENAMTNSKWLEKQLHIKNENPMTNVHRLIEVMQSFSLP